MFNSDSRNSSYAQKSVFFLGESPGLGPNPGLLGHGSKIPDRTIETHTSTDLFSKFQLSRCYTGLEIAHRQTDGRILVLTYLWDMQFLLASTLVGMYVSEYLDFKISRYLGFESFEGLRVHNFDI
jgi:hypothetical protein